MSQCCTVQAPRRAELRDTRRTVCDWKACQKRASIKVALRQPARVMLYLTAATRGQDYLTVGPHAAANVFTLAMTYHNGKAGRCGEWMKAKYKTTKQRLFAEKSDFLIATEHKCSKQRRSLVKVLAPATKKMLRIHTSVLRQRKYIDLFAPRALAVEVLRLAIT